MLASAVAASLVRVASSLDGAKRISAPRGRKTSSSMSNDGMSVSVTRIRYMASVTVLGNERGGFERDQPVRVFQPAHLNEGAHRTRFLERLGALGIDRWALRHVRRKDPHPHDVIE